MTDLAYRNDSMPASGSRMDWGAVWSGLFTFFAIWSVFGFLGIAILTRPSNFPSATTGGMSLAMEIWAIVLTLVAMYIAGRETGRLAAVSTRHDGLTHGMVMFGLSVIAVLLIAVFGSINIGAASSFSAGLHSGSLPALFVNLGWTGFLSLFLGWLAALSGASTGAQRRKQPERAAQPIRPAA